MKEYNELSLKLEETYSMLEKSVENVNSLKGVINELTLLGESLNKITEDLYNSEKLKKLKNFNDKMLEKISNDIKNIENNFIELESYGTYFEESVKSINERITDFSKDMNEKNKDVNKIGKELAQFLKTMQNYESSNSKSRKRMLQIADEISIFKKYEEVQKEQQEQRAMLEKILNILEKKNET